MSASPLVPVPAQPMALVHEGNALASLCRESVLRNVVDIKGKNFLKVEGWMSISSAAQCTVEILSVKDVVRNKCGQPLSGLEAEAVLKRDSDGYILTRGFATVMEDEYPEPELVPYNSMYAKVQSRAISRACRHKFSFVLSFIPDKHIEATPYDEVPPGGFEPQGGFPQANATHGPPAKTRTWTPRTTAQPRQATGTPPQSPTDPFLWEGTIKGVQIKEGTKQTGAQAGQPYQLFIIRLVDGREAVTFDTDLGEVCSRAVGYQCSLSVKPSRNRPGKFVAEALLPARNHQSAPAVQPPDEDDDYNE